MEFDEIDQLMQQRQQSVKKEKSQIGYGITLIFIGIIVCVLLLSNYYTYAITLGVGMIIGIVLRYSRFCFAAAFRDPFITGNTKVIRGIILGLIVSTIGFGVIQSAYLPRIGSGYEMIPGAISAVGIHTMIGAFVFGIGMVLAGGCASGLLMRIGEGHAIHLVVIIGFIIGTLLGAKDYGFWYKFLIKHAKPIYFPDYLNIKAVVLIQVTILIILYKVALWYEKTHVKQ